MGRAWSPDTRTIDTAPTDGPVTIDAIVSSPAVARTTTSVEAAAATTGLLVSLEKKRAFLALITPSGHLLINISLSMLSFRGKERTWERAA